jgi:hypothetical protein
MMNSPSDGLEWYPEEREDGYPNVENFDFFHIGNLPKEEAWTYIYCGSAGERDRAVHKLLLDLHHKITHTQAQYIEKLLSDNLAIRRLQLVAINRQLDDGSEPAEITGYVNEGFHGRNGDWRIIATSKDGEYYVIEWVAPGADDPAFYRNATGIIEALILAASEPWAEEKQEWEWITLPYGPFSHSEYTHRLQRISRGEARIVIEGGKCFNLLDALDEIGRTRGKFDDSSYFDYSVTVHVPHALRSPRTAKHVEHYASKRGITIIWY